MIISKDLEAYLESLTIDGAHKFTPFRGRKNKSPIFPDHYALLLKLTNVPRLKEKVMNGVREVMWNLKKEGGWENYFKHTNSNKKLDSVVTIPEEDSESMMKKIDKEVNNVKHVVFGKMLSRYQLLFS